MANPNILCDTAGMDRERWLECRMHGPKGDIPYTVGSSDVATIFGLSPWTTPLELWRIKKGLMVPSLKDNEDQLEMGHLLEPIAAYWYGKKTGNIVTDDTNMYQHADFPYALANFDRRFEESTGLKGLVECKSTTFHKAPDWADGAIPIYYDYQLRFALAVDDSDVGDFSCMWGNNPKTDIVTPRIHRDKFLEDIIFEKLERWIWSLENDKPPTMADVDPSLALKGLAKIYGASKGSLPTLTLPSHLENSARKIAELQASTAEHNAAIKNNEKGILAHSVRIAEIMKEHQHAVLETTEDKLLIDYVSKFTKRPSSDLLKKDHPDVYDEVLKTTESRKVKVTVRSLAS